MTEKLYDKIKNSDDIRKEIVHVPQWDCDVEARTMSGLERAMLLGGCIGKDGNVIQSKFQSGLLIACLHDPETGEKLFSESDAEWLMGKSSGAIEKLASVAMRLSGLTKEAMEDAEKNSSQDIPK